jgi:hypothetical protein
MLDKRVACLSPRLFLVPELEELIVARRLQIRSGLTSAALDDDDDDGRHGSSSSSSTGQSTSHAKSSNGRSDGVGGAATARRQAREAALHAAVAALSSAVHELDSLGSGNEAAPTGVFDFLREAKGDARLALEEFGPAADPGTSSSARLSLALRLKRKRQQLTSAAACLRTAADALAAHAAANRATARQMFAVAKHWRVVAPALGTGGRLLCAATGALAVDCSLASAGGAPAAAWNTVPLRVCPLSGELSCAPRLAVEQCLLVLRLEYSTAGPRAEECGVAAALGPSLRTDAALESSLECKPLSASLEASLAAVQVATLSRELMAAMRAEALAVPDPRWLPRAGTSTQLSVLAVSESAVSVEVARGVTLTAQLCSPAAAARATASDSLAATLLRRSVELLVASWGEGQVADPKVRSRAALAGQEPKATAKRVKKTATGADFAVVKADRQGALLDKEKPFPAVRVALLSALAASARHALLLQSLQAALGNAACGWAVDAVGEAHWAAARSRHRLRCCHGTAHGQALFVTVNGATGCLDLDASAWEVGWASRLPVSMGVGECVEFCRHLLPGSLRRTATKGP